MILIPPVPLFGRRKRWRPPVQVVTDGSADFNRFTDSSSADSTMTSNIVCKEQTANQTKITTLVLLYSVHDCPRWTCWCCGWQPIIFRYDDYCWCLNTHSSYGYAQLGISLHIVFTIRYPPRVGTAWNNRGCQWYSVGEWQAASTELTVH